MNIITVAGKIYSAEMKHLPSGDSVLEMVVIDSQGKDKNGNWKPTIFWDAALYGKHAEAMQPYLKKGQPVTLAGNVTEREYTDRSGNKRRAQTIQNVQIVLQGSPSEKTAQTTAKPAAKTVEQYVPDDSLSDIPF